MNRQFRNLFAIYSVRTFVSTSNRALVYTDGSFIKTKTGPGSGGIGVHFADKHYPDISENYSLWFDPYKFPPTSNRCELLAIYRTISVCLAHNIPAEIHTDSEYAINSIVYYGPRWNANGWYKLDGKPVKNIDLILPMYLVCSRMDNNFVFKHVQAHQKNKNQHTIGNTIADALAKQGAKNIAK